MKAFLFLYPVNEYFEICLQQCQRDFTKNHYNHERINDIIDARYRQKGYAIHWLLFSAAGDSKKPDLSTISNCIKTSKKDIFLTAGVSFEEHAKGKKYPDPAFILAQIPNLTELALGGFHQWDCVDRLAEYAHQNNMPTFVDEDTTELFFVRTSLCGPIPLVRETLTLEDLGINKQMMKFAKEARKNKPWFIQA